MGLVNGFLSSELDSVNLFNGNLVLRVPISQTYRVGGSLSYQLVLYYNSNLWNYEGTQVSPYVGEHQDPRCVGCDTNNAGAGWRLSPFGHRFFPDLGTNDTGLPMLMEADGTRRLFYPSLHDGEPFVCLNPAVGNPPPSDCDEGYHYTRDGSYLRAKIETVQEVGTLTVIESPDGTKRHYDEEGYPVRVEDLFGNSIDITRRNYNGGGTAQCQTGMNPFSQHCWKISDSTGRTIFVHFRAEGVAAEKQLAAVEVAAFGGQTSTIRFSYELRSVTNLDKPNDPDGITLPFLTSVSLATEDGTPQHAGLATYEFDYYETNLLGQGEYSGAMRSVTLPTGGVYEWEYGAWGATGCAELAAFEVVEGAISKKIFESSSAGTPIGTWTYEHDPNFSPGVLGTPDVPSSDPLLADTRRTLVTSPEGHQSLYYFSSEDHTGSQSCELSKWWNGLPFTLDASKDIDITSPSQLLYRSSELYDGPVSPGNLVRTNYVRYTADEGADETQGNHRLLRDHTYFNDDVDEEHEDGFYRGTKRSDFDGLGHFRAIETESDFERGGVDLDDEKTITTNFNPEANSYDYDIGAGAGGPTGSFSVPPTEEPWLVTDFDKRTVAEGTDTSTQLFCFDQSTGFLQGIRTLATNSATGSEAGRDLLEIRTPDTDGLDGDGNIETQKFYGGDGAGMTTTGCTTGNGELDYTLEHKWQDGVLKETDYKDGPTVVLDLVTRTIDNNTGLIKDELDVSKQKTTSYSYDRLSRVTEISREDLATTAIEYFQADGAQPAIVAVTEKDGATPLASSETVLDPFGRVEIEKIKRSLGTFSQRRFCYNAQGWLTKRGEWNAGVNCPSNLALNWTHFEDLDRFGRATIIYPPDGGSHRVNLDWKGERELTRTVRIATDDGITACASPGDENCARTSELYDGLGRLRRVSELDGALTARYEYDESDRLKEVKLNPGAQTRSFFYDGRGFLQCEEHPETNGTHYKYDALGNVTQRYQADDCSVTDPAGFDLTFEYDRAERLTLVRETGGNTLKEFGYALGNGRGASWGKLIKATRHNWVDLGTGTLDVKVVEDYWYQANGGAVSERQTEVSGGGFDLRWRLDQELTKLGDLDLLQYPCFADSAYTCLETQRHVRFGYENGWLTSISSETTSIANYVTGVTYHGNGMLNQLTYADGSLYGQTEDPRKMQRPGGMSFQGSTFTYAYDGSSNIKTVTEAGTATTTYRYDTRNRLESIEQGATTLQTYTYDNYGNLTSIAPGVTIPINSATNRISNATVDYDDAGNMTVSPAGVPLEYDSLSMLTKNGTSNDTYLYTADDERIGAVRSDGSATWRLRGLDGLVLGEYESDIPGACQPAISVTGTIGVNDPQCYESTGNLTSDATILSGADVSFRADNSIILENGFTVSSGAQFRAGPRGIGGGDTFWTRDYVHGLGYLLATNGPSGGRRYIGPDWLGTPRIVKTPGGNQDNVLLGFGEEDSTEYPASDLPLLFTGHERDRNGNAGVDLDYMHARYYWPLYGRFTSPDPIGGNPLLPQSWNRYAYVMNNPTNLVDPYGLQFECNRKGCSDDVTVTDTAIDVTLIPVPIPPLRPRPPFGGGGPGQQADGPGVSPGSTGESVCAEGMRYNDCYQACNLRGLANAGQIVLPDLGSDTANAAAFVGGGGLALGGAMATKDGVPLLDETNTAVRSGIRALRISRGISRGVGISPTSRADHIFLARSAQFGRVFGRYFAATVNRFIPVSLTAVSAYTAAVASDVATGCAQECSSCMQVF